MARTSSPSSKRNSAQSFLFCCSSRASERDCTSILFPNQNQIWSGLFLLSWICSCSFLRFKFYFLSDPSLDEQIEGLLKVLGTSSGNRSLRNLSRASSFSQVVFLVSYVQVYIRSNNQYSAPEAKDFQSNIDNLGLVGLLLKSGNWTWSSERELPFIQGSKNS